MSCCANFREGLPGYSLELGRPSLGSLVMYFGIHGMGTAVVLFCASGAGAPLFGQNLLQGVTLIWQKGFTNTHIFPSVVNPRCYQSFLGFMPLVLRFLVPRPVKGLEVVCLDVGQDGLLPRLLCKRAVLI